LGGADTLADAEFGMFINARSEDGIDILLVMVDEYAGDEVNILSLVFIDNWSGNDVEILAVEGVEGVAVVDTAEDIIPFAANSVLTLDKYVKSGYPYLQRDIINMSYHMTADCKHAVQYQLTIRY